MWDNSRWVLDRFEGKDAVLVRQGERKTISRASLPPEAAEGDVLDDAFQPDKEETRRRRELLRRKIEALKEKSVETRPSQTVVKKRKEPTEERALSPKQQFLHNRIQAAKEKRRTGK